MESNGCRVTLSTRAKLAGPGNSCSDFGPLSLRTGRKGVVVVMEISHLSSLFVSGITPTYSRFSLPFLCCCCCCCFALCSQYKRNNDRDKKERTQQKKKKTKRKLPPKCSLRTRIIVYYLFALKRKKAEPTTTRCEAVFALLLHFFLSAIIRFFFLSNRSLFHSYDISLWVAARLHTFLLSVLCVCVCYLLCFAPPPSLSAHLRLALSISLSNDNRRLFSACVALLSGREILNNYCIYFPIPSIFMRSGIQLQPLSAAAAFRGADRN